MPLEDWDGTAVFQNNRAEDWDGTTAHQIGKVEEWDGTTNHLIYTAELVVVQSSAFANGYAFTKHLSNWLSEVSGTKVTQYRPDQVSSGHYVTSAYLLLPTSGYDTITLTYSSTAHDGNAAGIAGGAAAALRSGITGIGADSGAMAALTSGAKYSCGNTWGGSTTSKTVTWDISSLTTDYYLQVAAYQYHWANTWDLGARFTIEKLILS